MPATRLNPMVCVDNAREAIEYYIDIFGFKVVSILHSSDPKDVTKFEIAKSLDTVPVGRLINFSRLATADGLNQINVFDQFEETPYHTAKDTMHIGIGHSSVEEQQQVYERLQDGGKVLLALHKTFWYSMYFIVQDKFGVVWQSDFPLHSGAPPAPTTSA
eukprot:gene18134-21670_t